MPSVTTWGLRSLKTRKRQYRRRYHGVHARSRTTQRSDASERTRGRGSVTAR